MSNETTGSSDPIDAEFEPVDPPQDADQGDGSQARSHTRRGPGWSAFAIVTMIALGALGLAGWNSGLFQQDQLPSNEQTALAALGDRQSNNDRQIEEVRQRIGDLDDRTKNSISELKQTVSKLETASQTPTQAPGLPALQERIAALESRLNTIADNTPRADRIAELESAVEDARTGSGSSAEQISALRSDMAQVQDGLNALQQNQSSLSGEVGKLRSETQTTSTLAAKDTAAALAFSSLESAAARGEAFEAQFKQLKSARPSDADVQALAALSRQPTPTIAALTAQFETLKPDALKQDTSSRGAPGWVESLFGETVSLRRTDPASPTATQLASATNALARNDLAAAITSVDQLPPASGEVFGNWLSDAKRRQQLDAALATLRLNLIEPAP